MELPQLSDTQIKTFREAFSRFEHLVIRSLLCFKSQALLMLEKDKICKFLQPEVRKTIANIFLDHLNLKAASLVSEQKV